MDISKVKGKSKDMLKAEFFDYLQTAKPELKSPETYRGDVFYLWKHGSEETFWRIIASDNYRKEGYEELKKLLLKDSKNPVTNSRISGYLTSIRYFRDFIKSKE